MQLHSSRIVASASLLSGTALLIWVVSHFHWGRQAGEFGPGSRSSRLGWGSSSSSSSCSSSSWWHWLSAAVAGCSSSGGGGGESCRYGGMCEGVLGAIGDTPLIRIASLSRGTGCEIYGKAEFLNPGGSVKDRVALQIVREAMQAGSIRRGALITEGTAGSTGISLAMVAAAYGCRCFIALPDDAAIEKANMLRALGAEVQRVRPVSITHPEHHVNVARRKAAAEPEESGGALFADQFENPANCRAHLQTGEEIWRQTGGRVDAFVSGSGTGGTLAGVSQALKGHNPNVAVYLVDPPGSGLYNKVTRGVMYTREEAEGKRLRNPFDTITEGIGINRLTRNFEMALIDGAFRGSDREAVEMAHYLLRNDGLFVGSSAAMNCVGAVKAARRLTAARLEGGSAAAGGSCGADAAPSGAADAPAAAAGSGLKGRGQERRWAWSGTPPAVAGRPVIVTILCDGGARHLSKFHNPEYLAQCGMTPTATGSSLSFVACEEGQ